MAVQIKGQKERQKIVEFSTEIFLAEAAARPDDPNNGGKMYASNPATDADSKQLAAYIESLAAALPETQSSAITCNRCQMTIHVRTGGRTDRRITRKLWRCLCGSTELPGALPNSPRSAGTSIQVAQSGQWKRSCRSAATTSPIPSLSIADRIDAFGRPLTAVELAKLLGVSRITIFKLAKADRIPSFKVATCVRFDPHAVARWLRAQSSSAASRGTHSSAIRY
jgi:excisionase family DNA binding protein